MGPSVESMADEFLKIANDLTAGERAHIKDKNFAEPKERKYPIQDEQHARSAVGFAKMHHDPALPEIMAKVQQKYPHLLKKASGIMQRIGHGLQSDRGVHGAELAGLGMLAALPADHLQAHLRSRKGEDWEKKSLLGGEKGHAVGDIAGLGVLAAPSLAAVLSHKKA